MTDQQHRLVEQHLPYAEALAREVAQRLPRWVPFDDLRQAAHLGLVEAAARFHRDAGVAFSTFAHPRIRGSVWDAVRKMRDIPPHLRTEARRQAAFAQATEDLPGAVERGAATAEQQLRRAIDVAGMVVLLSDVAADEDQNSPELAADPECSPLERSEERQAIQGAIAALPSRLRTVVEAVVFEGRRQVDIAAERHCDKSVVNRLWKEALEALRGPLAAAFGDRRSTAAR